MKKSLLCSLVVCLAVSGSLAQATTPTPKAKTSKKKVPQLPSFRSIKYDILFKGKKIGFVSQRETFQANGDVLVEGKSQSLFRVFFFKVNTTLSFRSLYRKGRLIKYSLNRLQRGKRLVISAKMTKKGYRVVHTLQKKRQVRLFPKSSFDATNREFRLPIKVPGTLLKRKVLNFMKLKITAQILRYKKKIQRRVLGKQDTLSLVMIKGARGSAKMFFNPRGAMVESFTKIPMLGHVGIRLREVLGRRL